ncbi:MAG: hypothetical protein IRZ33_09490, partial [Alicyclobacillaceae bacterium]|nr:hypothetical protein [Alicyclobacillaceae bacterium]
MTARQRRTGGSRAANWQQRWNPFWSLADPARLRRARALARDGHVLRWSVQGGRVEALVRSVRS